MGGQQKMDKSKYTLGLDIGIGSIGWAVLDCENSDLIDFGSRIFEEAKPAADSRKYRSARRNNRRKKWRKQQLKNAFVDFGILKKSDFEIDGFESYTTNNEQLQRPKDDTVYHLRQRAIHEQVSKREIFLCLYNILQARGHFLMETIDFERESVTYDLFKERFYTVSSKYVKYIDNRNDFEDKILKKLFENHFNSNDLKRTFKEIRIAEDGTETALLEILKLLNGNKANIKSISEDLIDEEKTQDIISLKSKADDLDEFLLEIIELYDLIRIYQVLKDHDYICDVDVELLDEDLRQKKNINSSEFNDYRKSVTNKMTSVRGNRLRAVRNIDNNYPNGLYLKEVSAILHKQMEFYEKDGLTLDFIEVCKDIVAARIPYYIGPLSKDAKNGWVEKTANFKYSYDYSKKYLNSVNEHESIRRWKERMISHCTYLPEEYALPKGSFIGETFKIINELNIKTAKTKYDDDYYLTAKDKIKIFDELYLKQSSDIEFEEIVQLLDLKYFGTKNNSRIRKMNNKFTLYHQIVKVLPELKIDSILEIFSDSEKISKIENIILDINLFDEEKSKQECFKQDYGFDEKTAAKLAKIVSNNFDALSYKFIMDYPMNQKGQSMMEILFEDNSGAFVNEQETIITNATDNEGNRVNLCAKKYKKLIDDNEGKLSVNLLIDDSKPIIPISRAVVRSLNECFKVYNQIIEYYGIPERVVIETARDLKDSSIIKEIPAKHFKNMEKLYDSLYQQLKEQKLLSNFDLEEWDELEKYLSTNKNKIELYIRQNGRDMITNEKIDLTNLKNYEIDHILPRGFGIDSMDDKILISKKTNQKKGNRVPLQFLESPDGVEYIKGIDGGVYETSKYKQRVEKLFNLHLISEKKRNMLLLETDENVEGFINRNLVDTRYIIRELMAILDAYNQYHEYDTHVVALKSAFTSAFRKAFEMKKTRDLGCQHHAHDAAIVAIADRVLSVYYPNYDCRGNFDRYHEFIKRLVPVYGPEADAAKTGVKEQKDQISRFLRYAYSLAFNEQYNNSYSLVSKIKATKPLYSLKVEKKYVGQYFDATLYSHKDKVSPLSVLGVNDNMRDYTGVNCAAVDFYKYSIKDKKGNIKKKHLAVHIPYLIIDRNGNIDQEKYKKLIVDWYKTPELLDENGNLKTCYFRFRAYKNDLVYDTLTKTVQSFNVGSIAKKQLEFKHINIFSYDDIYNFANHAKHEIIDKFKLYCKDSGNKKFDDEDREKVNEFVIKNIMTINDFERYKQGVIDQLNSKDIKGINSYCEMVAFLQLIVNRKNTWPKVICQYTPMVNHDNLSNEENKDAMYIKLKYNVLGIRIDNYLDKLFIRGPRFHENAYSKISKENFTWNMKNEML